MGFILVGLFFNSLTHIGQATGFQAICPRVGNCRTAAFALHFCYTKIAIHKILSIKQSRRNDPAGSHRFHSTHCYGISGLW